MKTNKSSLSIAMDKKYITREELMRGVKVDHIGCDARAQVIALWISLIAALAIWCFMSFGFYAEIQSVREECDVKCAAQADTVFLNYKVCQHCGALVKPELGHYVYILLSCGDSAFFCGRCNPNFTYMEKTASSFKYLDENANYIKPKWSEK